MTSIARQIAFNINDVVSLNRQEAKHMFTVEDAPGIFDHPELRSKSEARLWDHGDFSERLFYAPRYITLMGNLFADDADSAVAAYWKLSGALANKQAFFLGWTDTHDAQWWVRAEPNGQALRFSWTTESSGYYQISIKCSDPVIYGVQETFTVLPTN